MGVSRSDLLRRLFRDERLSSGEAARRRPYRRDRIRRSGTHRALDRQGLRPGGRFVTSAVRAALMQADPVSMLFNSQRPGRYHRRPSSCRRRESEALVGDLSHRGSEPRPHAMAGSQSPPPRRGRPSLTGSNGIIHPALRMEPGRQNRIVFPLSFVDDLRRSRRERVNPIASETKDFGITISPFTRLAR